MKKILIMISLLAALPAFADINTSAGSTADAGSTAVAQGGDVSNRNLNGAAAGIDARNYSHAIGSDLSNAVGVAFAPALATTLTETCMGSTSFGAGFSGGSFSFGTTWRDTACVRRLDARQMSAFGEIPVAVEMMCDSDLVREAAIRAGRPCVADGGTPRAVPVVQIVQEQAVPTPEAAAPVVNKQVHQ